MNIPLFKIYWDEEDLTEVSGVIKSGAYWTTGPKIIEFEKKIAEYIGSKYCVTFNSGTSALHAVLLAHNIGYNDEVIVPSFTFIATANAPLFIGAKPVFADIDENTYGLDPKSVESKITKNTKAIIPIHYGGGPCQIEELKNIAKKHGLKLIEDCAESFGAKIKNKNVGTFGDSAMFSFCQNKIITTGEGGCITTNSSDVYDKLKLLRSHGRLEDKNYFASSTHTDYTCLGYNFRMSDITAALGIAQIKKLDKIIQLRQKNAEYLTKKLSNISQIITPKHIENYSDVHQMYTIKIQRGEKVRDALSTYLSSKGVSNKVYFYPIHLTKFYREKFNYKLGDLPITENISNQVLSLPMYPTLSEVEMDYIAETIACFFKEHDAQKAT